MGDSTRLPVSTRTDSLFQSNTTQFYNTRGRPVKSKNIQFSPQPMSMISKLLRKNEKKMIKYSENTNEKLPKQIENDTDKLETDMLCPICSYRSCNKKEYKRHLNVHKKYTCEYPKCTYSTTLSSNLIKHKRKHTSEKPFLCDQCTFRTNFINSLTVHKRIHTAERPYACKFCSYKCNSSSNLKKHCLHRHVNDTS